jgi:hypothetical protein
MSISSLLSQNRTGLSGMYGAITRIFVDRVVKTGIQLSSPLWIARSRHIYYRLASSLIVHSLKTMYLYSYAGTIGEP